MRSNFIYRAHIKLSAAIIAVIAVLSAAPAFAVLTPAGTVINNTATANYDVMGTPLSASGSVSFVVQELQGVTITWMDSGNVPSASPSPGMPMTMRITNTGNGTDSYALSVNNALAGDNFDPTFASIYLDNGDGIYDPSTDILYISGVNDPVIAAGAFQTVFIINSIPSGQASGSIGKSAFNVASKSGTGAPGTIIAGGGDSGTDLVIGPSGGTGSATGQYQVLASYVDIVKTAVVIDQYGGSNPMTGATITYTLTVTVIGPDTINNIVITDSIPANTTYVTGNLKLNGGTLTDNISLDDEGDYNITNSGAITVNLGTMTNASAAKTVSFKVTIN